MYTSLEGIDFPNVTLAVPFLPLPLLNLHLFRLKAGFNSDKIAGKILFDKGL